MNLAPSKILDDYHKCYCQPISAVMAHAHIGSLYKPMQLRDYFQFKSHTEGSTTDLLHGHANKYTQSEL